MDVTIVAIIALLLIAILFLFSGEGSKFELHGYQKDFLDSLGSAQNKSAAEALQDIVEKAMKDEKTRSAIFDTFHCVHCGSVSPAEWINARKGNKQPVALPLSDEALRFLGKPILAPVDKVGDPKIRQVVPGPRTSNRDKAVRCCIDWAIKNYGATADGKPRPE